MKEEIRVRQQEYKVYITSDGKEAKTKCLCFECIQN